MLVINEHPEYYQSFEPYSQDQCTAFKQEIERLLATPGYEYLQGKI